MKINMHTPTSAALVAILGLTLLLLATHTTSAYPSDVEESYQTYQRQEEGTLTPQQQRQAEQEAKKAAKAAEREEAKRQKLAQREKEREAKAAEREAEKEKKKAAKAAERQAARQASRKEGRAYPTLTTQCLDAMRTCPIQSIAESEMKPTWERTTLQQMIKDIYRTRKEDLLRLKAYVNELIDTVIKNPSVDPLTYTLCPEKEEEVPRDQPGTGTGGGGAGNDPWTPPSSSQDPWTGPSTTPDPRRGSPSSTADPWTRSTSTADPWTGPSTLPPVCTCSQWSQWSQPYGYGQQDRVRVIVQPGQSCPYEQNLREERDNPSTTTGEGEYVSDNVTTVSINFNQDFVNAFSKTPRDLLVVVDSSGSITDEDFQIMKEGIKILIGSLCGGFGPGEDQHHLALVQFSNQATTVHQFKDSQSPKDLNATVDSMKPQYGFTCTGSALQLAYDQFLPDNGARDFIVHETLIITDGQSNCQEDLLSLSQTLQTRSPNVYALTISLSGDLSAQQEVRSLVTNSNARHLFSLAKFQDFYDMVNAVRKIRDQSGACVPIAPDN